MEQVGKNSEQLELTDPILAIQLLCTSTNQIKESVGEEHFSSWNFAGRQVYLVSGVGLKKIFPNLPAEIQFHSYLYSKIAVEVDSITSIVLSQLSNDKALVLSLDSILHILATKNIQIEEQELIDLMEKISAAFAAVTEGMVAIGYLKHDKTFKVKIVDSSLEPSTEELKQKFLPNMTKFIMKLGKSGQRFLSWQEIELQDDLDSYTFQRLVKIFNNEKLGFKIKVAVSRFGYDVVDVAQRYYTDLDEQLAHIAQVVYERMRFDVRSNQYFLYEDPTDIEVPQFKICILTNNVGEEYIIKTKNVTAYHLVLVEKEGREVPYFVTQTLLEHISEGKQQNDVYVTRQVNKLKAIFPNDLNEC